ncbi:MAG: hypothetical protein ACUVQ1_07085 [Candidatus Kapaibacteriales bacterium]
MIELFAIDQLYSSVSFNKFSKDLENFIIVNEIKVVSPMIYQNTTTGVVILGKRLEGGEYSEDNLRFIQSFSNTAVLALENFRLV